MELAPKVTKLCASVNKIKNLAESKHAVQPHLTWVDWEGGNTFGENAAKTYIFRVTAG